MSISKPLRKVLALLFATGLAFSSQGGAFAVSLTDANVVTPDPVDVISLSSDGQSFTSSLTQPVFQSPLVVPGDIDSRSIFVKNAGTESGTLTARIINVAFGQDLSNEFYDEFKFQGRPVRDFFAQELVVAQQALAPGQVYELVLDYAFPVEATVGAASLGAVQVSFDVEFTLRGGSDSGSASPDSGDQDAVDDSTSPPGVGSLPRTGVQLAGLLFGVAVLVAGGWLLVRLTRSE